MSYKEKLELELQLNDDKAKKSIKDVEKALTKATRHLTQDNDRMTGSMSQLYMKLKSELGNVIKEMTKLGIVNKKVLKTFDSFTENSMKSLDTSKIIKVVDTINQANLKIEAHNKKFTQGVESTYASITKALSNVQNKWDKINITLKETKGLNEATKAGLKEQGLQLATQRDSLQSLLKTNITNGDVLAETKAKLAIINKHTSATLSTQTKLNNSLQADLAAYKEKVALAKKLTKEQENMVKNSMTDVDTSAKYRRKANIAGVDRKYISDLAAYEQKLLDLTEEVQTETLRTDVGTEALEKQIAVRKKNIVAINETKAAMDRTKTLIKQELEALPTLKKEEVIRREINDQLANSVRLMNKYESATATYERTIKNAQGFSKDQHIQRADNELNNNLKSVYREHAASIRQIQSEINKYKAKLDEANLSERERQKILVKLADENNKLKTATKAAAAAIDNQNKSLAKTKDMLAEKSNYKWIKNIMARTAAYTSMYQVLNLGTRAIKSSITYLMEFDRGARTLAAVSDVRGSYNDKLKVAVETEKQLVELTKQYGDSLEDVNKVALALTRAGIAQRDIIASTEGIMALAKLTGDTIEQSAGALVTYLQVYGEGSSAMDSMKVSTEGLLEKLAYMANASKMATEDIATFSNYALSAAKAAGASANIVSAFGVALTNAGSSASVAGTGTRKFFQMINDGSEKTNTAFRNMGISQLQFAKDMAKGGVEAEESMKQLIRHLMSMDEEYFLQSIAGLGVRQKEILTKMKMNGAAIIKSIDEVRDAHGQLEGVKGITESLGNSWARFGNTMRDIGGTLSSLPLEALTSLIKSANEGSAALAGIAMTIGTFTTLLAGASVKTLLFSSATKKATRAAVLFRFTLMKVKATLRSLWKNPAFIAISAAIGVGTYVLDKYLAKQEEVEKQEEKLKQQKEHYASTSIKGYEQEIDSIKRQLELLQEGSDKYEELHNKLTRYNDELARKKALQEADKNNINTLTALGNAYSVTNQALTKAKAPNSTATPESIKVLESALAKIKTQIGQVLTVDAKKSLDTLGIFSSKAATEFGSKWELALVTVKTNFKNGEQVIKQYSDMTSKSLSDNIAKISNFAKGKNIGGAGDYLNTLKDMTDLSKVSLLELGKIQLEMSDKAKSATGAEADTYKQLLNQIAVLIKSKEYLVRINKAISNNNTKESKVAARELKKQIALAKATSLLSSTKAYKNVIIPNIEKQITLAKALGKMDKDSIEYKTTELRLIKEQELAELALQRAKLTSENAAMNTELTILGDKDQTKAYEIQSKLLNNLIKLKQLDLKKAKAIAKFIKESKNIELKQKVKIDISSGISQAIIDGINGSNIEEIFAKFAQNLGNQMINASMAQYSKSLTMSMGSPAAGLGAGIAMGMAANVMSGKTIFGGSRETVIISMTDYLEEIAKATKETSQLLAGISDVSQLTGMNMLDGIQYGLYTTINTVENTYANRIKGLKSEDMPAFGDTVTSSVYHTYSNDGIIKGNVEDYFKQYVSNFDDTVQKVLVKTIKKSKRNWLGMKSTWTEYIYEYKSEQDMYFEAFSKLYDDFNTEGLDRLKSDYSLLVDFQRKLGNIKIEDDLDSAKEYLETITNGLININDISTLDDFKDIVTSDLITDIAVDTTQSIGTVETAFEDYYNTLTKVTNELVEDNNKLVSSYKDASDVMRDFVSSLDSLASSGQSVIDSLVTKAYTPQQSVDYYLGSSNTIGGSDGELNALMQEYESYFTNGILNDDVSYDMVSKTYNALNSMASASSNAITNRYKSSETGMGLQNDLLDKLQDYQKWLLDTEEILSVKIVDSGDITPTLGEIKTSLENNTKDMLATSIGIDSDFTMEDLNTLLSNDLTLDFDTNVDLIQQSIDNLNSDDVDEFAFESNIATIQAAVQDIEDANYVADIDFDDNLDSIKSTVANLTQDKVGTIEYNDNLNDIQTKLDEVTSDIIVDVAVSYSMLDPNRLDSRPQGIPSLPDAGRPLTFADGGYTPDVGDDKVVGVVHGGEYVAPARQVRKFPQLFKNLDNERTGYKSGGFVETNITTPDSIYELRLLRLSNERLEAKLDKIISNTSDIADDTEIISNTSKDISRNTAQQIKATTQLNRRQ